MAFGGTEGKTIDIPTSICSGCEDEESTQFCVNCEFALCLKCSRLHWKSKVYKNHTVISYAKYCSGSYMPVDNKPYKTVICTQHPQFCLRHICKQCVQIMCDMCVKGHDQTHEFLKPAFDINLLQNICLQTLPSLLEVLRSLEKCKDVSVKSLDIYKEAKIAIEASRSDIVTTVNDSAERLQNEIDGKIQELQQLKPKYDTFIQQSTTKIKSLMTELTEISCTPNPTQLLSKIGDCNIEISKVKSTIAKNLLNIDLKETSMDTLLPKMNTLKDLMGEVESFYTLHTTLVTQGDIENQFSSLSLAQEVVLPLVHEKDIFTAETRQADSEQVIFFETGSYHVSVYDFKQHLLQTFQIRRPMQITIQVMATLSAKRHVIIDTKKAVYLLDETFNIVGPTAMPTDEMKENFIPRALTPESDTSFLLLKSGRTKSKIVRVIANDDDTMTETCLGEIDVTTSYDDMSLHRGNRTVSIISSYFKVCIIDLETMTHKIVDLSPLTDHRLWTLVVDIHNNILVGDVHGNIIVLDEEGACRTVLGTLDTGVGRIGGIATRGQLLFVCVYDKLQMYRNV